MIQKLIEGNYNYRKKIIHREESIDYGEIPKYPILILTCMDPRIDVYRIFQLFPGDAFVLRNAGNVLTKDILRSVLVAVHEYHIKHIIILGHTDCVMKKFDLSQLRKKLNPATLKRIGSYGTNFQFELIKDFKIFVDEIRNIKNQINHFITSKEIPKDVEIKGMLYDTVTGWVFELNEFGDIDSYESFKANRKRIFIQKNSKFKEYLRAIKEIAREPPLKKEEEFIEIKPVGIVSSEPKFDPVESVEAPIEELQERLDLTMKIHIPQVIIPKIKVHVPTIYKKNIERET